MFYRFFKLIFCCVVCGTFFLLLGIQGHADEAVLTVSTTTSTQASGLLEVLLPEFVKDTGILVKIIAKGTGAALMDGMDGNVDAVFVHARERENKFVHDGYGTQRYPVMHNDFVLLGPISDPAEVNKAKSVAAAFAGIAQKGFPFISRGDDSGTHTKEQEIWKLASVQEGQDKEKSPKSQTSPGSFLPTSASGTWYFSIGQGMGKTIMFADEKQAYTLADRGTYLKYKYGGDLPISLVILYEGDEGLANPYGFIPVNPAKHPDVHFKEAKIFADWLVSERGQKLIGGYKVFGKQLFFPDLLSEK